MSTNLEAKCAERDALLSWLSALDRENASLEAVRLVQVQLDRVTESIARRSERAVLGYSLGGKSSPCEASGASKR